MYIVKCTYHNEDGTTYQGSGIDCAGRQGAKETIEYLQNRYDVSDVTMHMYYRQGKDNGAFHVQLQELKNKYTQDRVEHQGDYLVTYYYNKYERVEYWENMELGIPSEIIFKY